MFEAVSITKQSISNYKAQLDIGFLAEALLFYKSVHVIGDAGTLEQLIVRCGIDCLFELIESGRLKITFIENETGIETLNTGTSNELHRPVFVSGEKFLFQNAVPPLFLKATERSGKSRRLAYRLSKQIELISLDSQVGDALITDFEDQNYIQQSFVAFLRLLAPEYTQTDEVKIELIREGNHFRVDTNVDFSKANQSYVKHAPPGWTLTPAQVLANLFDVRKSLYFSSRYSSEIATNQTVSRLIEAKLLTMLPSMKSGMQIEAFQDFVMDDGRAIREAINSGTHTIAEFMSVLRESEKFRHWLNDQPQDVNLVKAYFREVTKESWVDNLPVRIGRWVLFTAAGIILELGLGPVGTIANLGLSAADSLLLDKISRGWRPDQFVEGALIPFVENA